MQSTNSYENTNMAEAYAKLEFPNTYYLAYRDIPEIISKHVTGQKALDFGCGTGRSTRFLHKLGFNTIGVDISEDMIQQAKELDPTLSYNIICDGDLSLLKNNSYDLVLAAFTFDNIPTQDKKLKNLKEIQKIMSKNSKLIILVSTPDIYIHEWASFSTKDFLTQNRVAKSGDKVKIIITDIDASNPVEDTVCCEQDYQSLFNQSGLEVEQIYKPLAKDSDPFPWVNETKIAPWAIYVLKKF